ncbi:MAG: membrane protein insertase YidC, partial [Cytophagales bacterium]
MDRNSAIGMVLIALLLMLYFYLSPSPQQKSVAKVDSTSVAEIEQKIDIPKTALVDSTIVKSYGSLGSYLSGNEQAVAIENQDLILQFSSHAIFTGIELKNFKTYTQEPLYLIQNGNNRFDLKAQYQNQNINLYQLYYQVEQNKNADSTVVSFTANVSSDTFIKHTYTIPAKGFKITYRIESKGLSFGGSNLALNWRDPIALQEKDLKDSRTKTTIHYYTKKDEHDYLSETSDDEKVLTEPLKWISIKQKFFISSIIAQNAFSGAELKQTTDVNNMRVVKSTDAELLIPTDDVHNGKANFTYYFGPNDYQVISEVTPGFSKNLSLGWPPMLWVNKFMVIPAFQFLERITTNYGLIIILLVLMVKLLLLPLSYTSYLG